MEKDSSGFLKLCKKLKNRPKSRQESPTVYQLNGLFVFDVNTFLKYKTKSERVKIKEKIITEIERANKKEKILSERDKEVLSKFFNSTCIASSKDKFSDPALTPK